MEIKRWYQNSIKAYVLNRGLCLFLFTASILVANAQQPDKSKTDQPSKPSILHISTHTVKSTVESDSLKRSNGILTEYESVAFSDSIEIVSLSLVDSVLYNNFESELAEFTKRQRSQYLLVAVAKKDSWQKQKFFLYLHQNRLNHMGWESAYTEALKQVNVEYDKLDFKSKLLKKD